MRLENDGDARLLGGGRGARQRRGHPGVHHLGRLRRQAWPGMAAKDAHERDPQVRGQINPAQQIGHLPLPLPRPAIGVIEGA